MSELTLTKRRILGGVWEGALSGMSEGDGVPALSVSHLDTPIESVTITADPGNPGGWNVRIEIPARILADGVQTILIVDPDTGDRLDSFTLVTGEPLEQDIRAEIDLLRAELDMLKRAFRRHCVETMGN